MLIRLKRLWLAALIAGTATCPAASTPGLKEAVAAAWQRQPQAQTAQARTDALSARRVAAGAGLAAPPAIGLTHETDQFNRDVGARSLAGQISLPLWLPGQQDRLKTAIDSERHFLDAALSAARWRVAGEVRESYWHARAASAEIEQASAAVEALTALETDVSRRAAAGELARVVVNRAQAEAQFQRIALAQARVTELRALQQFRALTGLTRIPDADEARWSGTVPPAEAHPALMAAAQQEQTARARLSQASSDTRDMPEIGIGTTRQRSDAAKPWEQLVLFRVRIPFGGDNRNLPRINAANADLIETQAVRRQSAIQIEAEAVGAERELQMAQGVLPLVASRLDLARDTQVLVARGFNAGEFDLVARLRAERELRDAELAHLRAVIDAGRANSRLKQSYGVLP